MNNGAMFLAQLCANTTDVETVPLKEGIQNKILYLKKNYILFQNYSI